MGDNRRMEEDDIDVSRQDAVKMMVAYFKNDEDTLEFILKKWLEYKPVALMLALTQVSVEVQEMWAGVASRIRPDDLEYDPIIFLNKSIEVLHKDKG